MSHEFVSPLRRWDVCSGLLPKGRSTFAEVGCKNGRTTSAVLQNVPGVSVVAVDPWAPLPNAAEDYSDHDFAKIEKEFWECVGPNRHRVKMLRMTSVDAAKECEPRKLDGETGKFDVVFIDAGHDFENCLADIKAWWPLVKDGGVLCGHDYNHKFPGVMQAVAKCFPLMNVAVCPDSVWVVQKTPQLKVAV